MRALILMAAGMATPAHAWEHIGAVWEGADLPVEYLTSDNGADNCLGDFPGGYCADEAAIVFQDWSDAGCTSFAGVDAGVTEGQAFGNGVNEIEFVVAADELEPGVLGLTISDVSGIAFSRDGQTYYAFSESDILINEGVSWGTHEELEAGNCSDESNFRAVLAHEVGHLAGLGHSCDQGDVCNDPDLIGALMFWTSPACDTISSPQGDDIAGLEALYGPAANMECGTSGAESPIGVAPFTLNCAVSAASPISEVSWTFGDGVSASGIAVSHTWEEEGTYTVMANISGNDAECGEWDTTVERKGYVRVCDRPDVQFELDHILGIRYDFKNQTSIPVVGCATDVRWALYKGPTATGKPFEVRENWEFSYEFPEEGEWTVVLNVGGPAGTSAAKATLDVKKHAGIHPFGCRTDDSSVALLFLPVFLLGRRRRRGEVSGTTE